MSTPAPVKIDNRDDGIVLWEYDFADQNRSVSIQAPTQKDADVAIQAYLAAQAAIKPVVPPLTAAIAALETLDQTKPATIGDVVSALKAIVS